MDHSEAVTTQAAERYLLHELTDNERSAFEEHYFCCQECAEEMRCGAILMENLGEVVRSIPATTVSAKPVPARRSIWPQWFFPAFAAAAIVLLAGVAGYQSLVTIPKLRSQASVAMPQVLTSVSLMSSVSRGGALPVVKIKPSEPFGLYLDIPPQSGISAFQCEFRSDSQTKFVVRIPEKQASDTVHLLIPGGSLAAGRYDLVISGISSSGSSSNAGAEIIRYSFQVENHQ